MLEVHQVRPASAVRRPETGHRNRASPQRAVKLAFRLVAARQNKCFNAVGHREQVIDVPVLLLAFSKVPADSLLQAVPGRAGINVPSRLEPNPAERADPDSRRSVQSDQQLIHAGDYSHGSLSMIEWLFELTRCPPRCML